MAICGKCKATAKNDSLSCFKCSTVFHKQQKCLNIPRQAVQWLKDSGCSFVCSDCTQKKFPDKKLPTRSSTSASAAASSSVLLDGSASSPSSSRAASPSAKNEEEKDEQKDDEIDASTSSHSLADWTAVVRKSIDKERRRREMIVAGFSRVRFQEHWRKRFVSRKEGLSCSSDLDDAVHCLLCHVGALADIEIGNYTWAPIGATKDRKQNLIKITFSSDVIVDRLIAFAPGLRYELSSFNTDVRKRVHQATNDCQMPLGDEELMGIFLRRSLSKEERTDAYRIRQERRAQKAN